MALPMLSLARTVHNLSGQAKEVPFYGLTPPMTTDPSYGLIDIKGRLGLKEAVASR